MENKEKKHFKRILYILALLSFPGFFFFFILSANHLLLNVVKFEFYRSTPCFVFSFDCIYGMIITIILALIMIACGVVFAFFMLEPIKRRWRELNAGEEHPEDII
jgi:hypothetical protein